MVNHRHSIQRGEFVPTKYPRAGLIVAFCAGLAFWIVVAAAALTLVG